MRPTNHKTIYTQAKYTQTPDPPPYSGRLVMCALLASAKTSSKAAGSRSNTLPSVISNKNAENKDYLISEVASLASFVKTACDVLLSLMSLSKISSGFENAILSRADLAEASVIMHMQSFCCSSVSAERSTEPAIIVVLSKNRRCLIHSGLAAKELFGAGWRGENVQIREAWSEICFAK